MKFEIPTFCLYKAFLWKINACFLVLFFLALFVSVMGDHLFLHLRLLYIHVHSYQKALGRVPAFPYK